MEPLVFDIARMIIQTYFNLMEYADATIEDQERLFKEEFEKFKKNKPGDLPDPVDPGEG